MSSAGRISYSGSQVRGDRWRQEDSYAFLAKDDWVLAVLADGCGGRPQGRETSKRAVRLFKELASAPGACSTDIAESLRAWTEAVHQAISGEMIRPDLSPGTTLIAARVSATDLHYVSVGDSLLFVAQEGRLQLLPNQRISDRTVVGLGVEEMLLGHVPLMPGDRVLLATDGLYPRPDFAPDFRAFMKRPLAQMWLDKDIVKAALQFARGAWAWGHDNCTVLCVSVPEDAP